MASFSTIESDPGVFGELIERFGCTGVEMRELVSLDPDEFARLGGVYGLIFLFKYESELEQADTRPTVDPGELPELFFANQVITNACATQAILSVLLNAEGINLGPTLSEFKSFTLTLPSDLKGLAISNSEQIREAHNSFARNDPFVMEEAKATKDDEVFHFVAYLPFGGKVYELDGLRPGPVEVGTLPDAAPPAAWLDVVTPVIQARMARYTSSTISFNLMAVTRSRLSALGEREAQLQAELESLESAGGSDAAKQAELEQVQADKRDAELEREAQRRENVRRKFNYVPFAVALLRALAKSGHLRPMVAAAEEKRDKQMSEAAAAKAAGASKA